MWFWTIFSLGAPDKSKMTTPKRSPSQLSDILSTKRENSAIFRNANDHLVKLVKSKSSKVTKPPVIRSLAADIVWILPFIVNWKNNSTVNCGRGGGKDTKNLVRWWTTHHGFALQPGALNDWIKSFPLGLRTFIVDLSYGVMRPSLPIVTY